MFEVEERKVVNGYKWLFLLVGGEGDGNVLKVDCVDGFLILKMFWELLNCIF